MTLGSVLLLGFLLGVRHAFEADHVAAVATLATRATSVRGMLRLAGGWGVGHAATIVAFGTTVMLLGTQLPASLSHGLERIVGVMLIVLGGDVLRRLLKRRVHVHVHEHDGGTRHVHFHAHEHEDERDHDPLHHEHAHRHVSVGRALLVGSVHGLAGSAALIVLTAQQAASLIQAVVFLIVFGAGATLGMLLFSLAMSLPLRAATRLQRFMTGIEGALAVVTIAIGVRILAS